MLLKIMIGFMFLRIMTYYRGNGKNSSDNYNPSLILLLLSGNLMNMVINGNNNVFLHINNITTVYQWDSDGHINEHIDGKTWCGNNMIS